MLRKIATKFQYLSDIHLERKIDFKFKKIKGCENLILAGDIGNPFKKNYEEFLTECSQRFEKVILIAGNHEYYGKEIEKVNDKIKILSEKNNISFLNNNSVKINNIRIFGGVLWSHIPFFEKEKWSCPKIYPRDILFQEQKMFPEIRNYLHLKCINELSFSLSNYTEDFVVVTHYIPSFSLILEKYKNYPNSYLYATNKISKCILNSPRIKKWVYGHTHTPSEQGKFICNPVGNKKDDFQKSFKIL